MQKTEETWVGSLGGGDPQKKGIATHSSILAWRISWTEGPGGLRTLGLQRVRTSLKQLSTHMHTYVTYSWHLNTCYSSISMVLRLWIQPTSHSMLYYSIYWKKTSMYVDLHSLKPCCSRVKCIILENRKKDSGRSMKRNIKGKKTAKDTCVTVEWSNIFATVVLVKGEER